MLQRVNDIELFYEECGQGSPIILLHGNGESHKIFHQLLKLLSTRYKVYAIDSRGHGQSTQVKSFDYMQMAEDIAEFIRVKGINKPILYGFSDGGILGLIIAHRYPDLLSRLIISGANTKPDGLRPFYYRLFKMIYFFSRSPKYKLMITQPDIKDEELMKISISTFVLAGSKDLISEIHTKHIASCIKGSTLNILKGENHMSYVLDNDKLYKIIEPYLS